MQSKIQVTPTQIELELQLVYDYLHKQRAQPFFFSWNKTEKVNSKDLSEVN